jgi:hypothetical protein
MNAKLLITFIVIFIATAASAQTAKGTLYKSGQWADIAGKGGFAKAMENPTYEKVEIYVTDKYIKATFGAKIYNYTIISSKRFSSVKMDYTVSLNGKTYILSVSDMMDGTYAINIDGVWMVSDIRDIKTVDAK